jgi:aminoglycoside phosphotransferase (APT) family kinase protein
MTALIDEPAALRAEDAPDLAALDAWLQAQVPGLTGEPTLAQYAGGASNLTFLVAYPGRELVVRTPPRGRKSAGSHDMGREALVMTALAGHFPVPPVVAQCHDTEVIGQPFYVMDRVRGVILRRDLPTGVRVDPAALAESYLVNLAQLHALDPAAVGLSSLDRGPGYVARQVAGWGQRWRAARTASAPAAEDLIGWLAQHQPADVGRCLIHNDWRFDNFILDPADLTRIIAVLDWEMATVGDPLMDLGGALAYWVQADDDPLLQAFRRQPSNLPGMPAREQLVQRYCELASLDLPTGFTFYEVFGLFRLAVIAQQIFYRYDAGQTSNPVFAAFGPAAAALVGRCEGLARSA